MRVRVAALLALLVAAGGVGVVSYERVRDQLAVLEACEATEAGHWAAALQRTEGYTGADATGRAAAECRCLALLATGAGSECIDLLERALSEPDADGWVPNPALAVHLIQTWRDEGRSREAAELARRAVRLHPRNGDLFYLELVTRSSVENEETVLREMEGRLPDSGPEAARMRVSLANRLILRGDPARALAALGEVPPRGSGDSTGLWFDTRGMAYATMGNLAGVQRSYREWKQAGGDPTELRARYALTLSIANLADPRRTPIELLREALTEGDRLEAKLHEALIIRLILTLVNGGRQDEALAVYDRERERFELAGLAREELERSATHRRLAGASVEERSGELRFAIPHPMPGGVLLLSPEPDAPVDADFEILPIPSSGHLTVTRAVGVAPQRWVYRDAEDRVLASGTVDPVAGSAVDIAVKRSEAQPPRGAWLGRSRGDGRRRVALILLDCADWRIVQYLRARGDLPVLDALIRGGYRAVLDSDPPLTGAALEALVWPSRRSAHSVVGVLHQLGVELAGLASIGENPFPALAWLLPEDEDLFSVLGSGSLSAANLLFAHGSIHAGRHSEITGPNGLRRRIPLAKSARDLDSAECARWPALARARKGRDAIHVRTIAAEFDTAENIVRAGAVDLFALRIEPLDILTHAHFADAVRDGQDDGRGFLFSIYRYIDARLGAVHDLLDQDDILIVMSDHGIRTAMEHSRHALFVATGEGVPVDRAAGRPPLRSVSTLLADLFGVPVDWPDAGIAPWARDIGPPAPVAGAWAKADPRRSPATR